MCAPDKPLAIVDLDHMWHAHVEIQADFLEAARFPLPGQYDFDRQQKLACPVRPRYMASTLLMNPRMAFANLSGASIAA